MQLPMKRLFFFLIMLSLAGLARADQQTQAVQQALKDEGFYYGDVDGQGGPETDAAVRRYQIRQGLEVTGKLNAQTLDSLNLGGDSKAGNSLQAVPPPSAPSSSDQSADSQPPAPAPQDTPVPKVVQSDRDFLRKQPQSTPTPDDDNTAPEPPSQPAPPADAVQPPQQPEPPDAGQAVPSDYARFFKKTPYETAPPVVQRSTVQRAQERLAREGFFRGIADGQPSDDLSKALAAYQRYAELRVTRRLDMDTLMDMNLLPRRRVVIRPPVPYGYGDPEEGRDVYRGLWVR